MKILCYIPARAGSTRIKNKNIKNFLGKPLIAYTIEQALSCDFIDRVIVDRERFLTLQATNLFVCDRLNILQIRLSIEDVLRFAPRAASIEVLIARAHLCCVSDIGHRYLINFPRPAPTGLFLWPATKG